MTRVVEFGKEILTLRGREILGKFGYKGRVIRTHLWRIIMTEFKSVDEVMQANPVPATPISPQRSSAELKNYGVTATETPGGSHPTAQDVRNCHKKFGAGSPMCGGA
jgi:hypothetical protein